MNIGHLFPHFTSFGFPPPPPPPPVIKIREREPRSDFKLDPLLRFLRVYLAAYKKNSREFVNNQGNDKNGRTCQKYNRCCSNKIRKNSAMSSKRTSKKVSTEVSISLSKLPFFSVCFLSVNAWLSSQCSLQIL